MQPFQYAFSESERGRANKHRGVYGLCCRGLVNRVSYGGRLALQNLRHVQSEQQVAPPGSPNRAVLRRGSASEPQKGDPAECGVACLNRLWVTFAHFAHPPW